MDANLTESLARALGHQTPFKRAELGQLSQAVILYAGDFAGPLEACANLETLTLFGCKSGGLDFLAQMKKLRILRIACMPVTDLSPLAKRRHGQLHMCDGCDATSVDQEARACPPRSRAVPRSIAF